MVYLKTDKEHEEYQSYIISAFKHTQEVYSKETVHFGTQKVLEDKNEITLFIDDNLCKYYNGPYTFLAENSFGLNKKNKIYIIEKVLHPHDLIPEEMQLKYLNRLINEEDIKHVFKTIYLHELQEIVLLFNPHFKYSEPHFMLEHFGGDNQCMNNFWTNWLQCPFSKTQISKGDPENRAGFHDHILDSTKEFIIIMNSDEVNYYQMQYLIDIKSVSTPCKMHYDLIKNCFKYDE